MKKLLILLLFPLMMFAQDSTLIGDVDCSGEVNSQDASLILQFVTNVIDELPCEANMTGLTPDQLQEMIDMMEDQLSINYTAGSGGGSDIRYPEGLTGEYIIESDFTVPANKNLYITNVNPASSVVSINGILFENIRFPLIASEGDFVSNSTFYGLLIDKVIEPISVQLSYYSPDGDDQLDYTVPDNKLFVILNARYSGVSSDLYVNGELVPVNLNNNNSGVMTMKGSDVLSTYESNSNSQHFVELNGYLVDEDYFSSAGSGGSGFDLKYPDGFLNLNPVTYNLYQDTYEVPLGQNLYITNIASSQPSNLLINDINMVTNGSNINDGGLLSPLIASPGDIISYNTNGNEVVFNGFLVTQTVEAITHNLAFDYVVPSNKILLIGNLFSEQNILIDNQVILHGSANATPYTRNGLGSHIFLSEGQSISQPDNYGSFNGYLVDEDYFSSAGSGANSAALDSTMVADMIQSALSNSVSIGIGDYYQGGNVVHIFQPEEEGYVFGEVHGYIMYYNNNVAKK